MNSKKITDKLNEILFIDWDPIEVSSNKLLCDEYYSYAQEIFSLLAKNKNLSEEDLVEKLNKYELENIGLHTSDKTKTAVAKKIISEIKL